MNPTTIGSLFGRLCVPRTAVTLVFIAGTAFAQSPQQTPPPAPRFAIQRYVIQGNTLLKQSDIDKVLAPFAGKDRDFGDIQRALEALQDLYIKRGFNAVRVQVPEQDIRAGEVTLRVVEARLANVRVENNKFFSARNIRNSLPALKEGKSPDTRAIGENAQLANDNPSKQVAVALQASDEPGVVDATVRVNDENPSRYSMSIDNTGTNSTGYYRAGIGYQNANMFNSDQVFNAQVITSPTRVSDVLIAGMGYRIPVYSWQGAFDVVGGYSNVNAGTVQDLFGVSGAGTIFGVRYTQYLPRFDIYDEKLSLGWDWRAYKNNVNLIGTTGSLVPDITIHPINITYTGRFSQVGRDVSFYLTQSWNIPGGNDGTQDDFTAQRAGAAAQYSIQRAGLVYTEVIGRDFLFRVAANGQYTRDLLVSGEAFGMGGMDSVRGFFEREVSNDVGHRVSVEAYTPDFGSKLGDGWRSRALLFTDMARGYDNVPVRSPNNGLGSVGIGLRLNQGKSLGIRMDWAYVYDGGGSRPDGSNRFDFAIVYSF